MNSKSSKMASGLSAVLAVLLVASTVALPGMGDEGPQAETYLSMYDPGLGLEALMEKADPVLVDRIEAGQTEDLHVILGGHPHVGVTEDEFPDRAAAMEELDRRTAPFFTVVEDLTDLLGGEVMNSFSAAPAIKVSGDLDLLKVLATLDDVETMTLDYVGALELVDETDEGFGIDPIPGEIGGSNSGGRQMIQAEQIWSAGFMGEGITISIIDTGVDGTHEAFRFADGSSRITAWANCQSASSGQPADCDTSGSPFDDHYHGTHVAGTAAGSDLYDHPTRGFFEEVGVAPRADIMAVKFLNSGGGGTFEAALASLQWSFDNDADMTSNSWGASSCGAGPDVKNLVNQLNDLGMLNVFAAGNSGSFGVGSPACAEKAFAIGAVDQNENIASFSSRGPCHEPETRICPHVVAKGVNVRSAAPTGYRTLSGTSMSTPHVAGAVALAEQMKIHFDGDGWDTPNLAERQVFTMTAKPLPDAGSSPNNDYGWGLVQLLHILALLEDSDDANIIDTFDISNEEVRLGESTTLAFSVMNLGSATADGDFYAELEKPDGSVEVLEDATVSLGLFDGESVAHTVTVAGNVLPGEYTFRGSFEYTWENESGEQSDLIEHEGTFEVLRVFINTVLEGLDEDTTTGTPQNLEFSATNTGNEAAGNTRIEFTVPDDYQFLPGSNWNPLDDNTRYADPAPDRVIENTHFNRITLVWEVGDLDVGDSWSFTSTVLPTAPQDDYRFMSVAKFQDGSGNEFGQTNLYWQNVSLV